MVLAAKDGANAKERGAKVSARKVEHKRVDHLARAIREQEISEIQLMVLFAARAVLTYTYTD